MREYVVIFEKTASGFSAYVPDLPGCVACADTCEETERLIHEAIALYVEELGATGDTIPEPTSTASSISV